jgi:hypothetical protein
MPTNRDRPGGGGAATGATGGLVAQAARIKVNETGRKRIGTLQAVTLGADGCEASESTDGDDAAIAFR